MASKFVLNCYFYNSYSPEKASPKQNKPRTTPQIKTRNAGKAPIRSRGLSKSLVIRPNDLTLTRALRAFVDAGSMDNALHLFEKMHHSDTFIWNVMIRGFTNKGMFQKAIDFFHRMEYEGIGTDNFTFPFVIKACSELLSLIEGQRVHAKLVKVGFDVDVYVCNFLMDMYVRFGFIELAEKVFDEMPVRDLVSWNSMVTGYHTVGGGLRSLMCFKEMLDLGKKPDRFTMTSALNACSVEFTLQSGKEIHCQVIRSGLESNIMIQTSLIDMYGKCGKIDYAEMAFNRISLKNTVVWNAMISGYSLHGNFLDSFTCLRRMQVDDYLIPDAVTIINLIPSCSQLGALLEGKSLHGYAIRKMLLPHLVLETAIVDMYGKCGEFKQAECVFDRMKEKNVVSWNTMISAYVQNGQSDKALELFQNLWSEPLRPDAVMIASILPAYSELGTLSEGKQIHSYVTKLGLRSNTSVSNAIVYMYAKCGDLQAAREFFDDMVFHDVVSWNTIIMAYAIHGFGRISIMLFSRMRDKGVTPNGSTFASLLSACSFSGLVDEGWQYFNSMKLEYNINPEIEHYSCMLDLLGRTGNLDAAINFIEDMPLIPTARIWGSLLTASRKNKDIAVAEFAAKNILSLEHDNTGCYVLLSNMYAEAGRWEDADRIKLLMMKKGLKRTSRCSTVETNGRSRRFINGDKSHNETNTIYQVLDIILKILGEDTYIGSLTKFRPLDAMKKEAKRPENHSIRLAVCYGLISTTIGKPVIVRKNIRICEDCHSAAKQMSLVSSREIVVGDSKVFHHFKDGICSCGDYW